MTEYNNKLFFEHFTNSKSELFLPQSSETKWYFGFIGVSNTVLPYVIFAYNF